MRKSLASKAEDKKGAGANNDADETPRPIHFSGQSQLSTRNNVEVHVTHFAKRFVILFQGSWMLKTSTGSQEVQQLWQLW